VGGPVPATARTISQSVLDTQGFSRVVKGRHLRSYPSYAKLRRIDNGEEVGVRVVAASAGWDLLTNEALKKGSIFRHGHRNRGNGKERKRKRVWPQATLPSRRTRRRNIKLHKGNKGGELLKRDGRQLLAEKTNSSRETCPNEREGELESELHF